MENTVKLSIIEAIGGERWTDYGMSSRQQSGRRPFL